MPDTITVPGIGKPVPKWAAGAGIAAVGVLAVMYYRKKSAAASAAPAASTATGQYPADGTSGNPSDPYSTDPATGQTYGNEVTGAYGTYGAFGTGTGYGTGTGGGTGNAGAGAGGPPFSDNAAWSAYAIQQAQAANPNIDTGALTDAIGLYLSGQGLTSPQRQYVFDAIALAGPVPVSGTNGYPPKLLSAGGGGGGTGGGYAVNPVTGLAAKPGTTSAVISWHASNGATGYQLVSQEHSGANSHTVSLGKSTRHTLTGLRRKTEYTVKVRAQPQAPGSNAASVSFRTA